MFSFLDKNVCFFWFNPISFLSLEIIFFDIALLCLWSKVNQNNEQFSSFQKNDSRIDGCERLFFFFLKDLKCRLKEKMELVEKGQEHLELNRVTWRVGARAAPLEFTLPRFIRKIIFHFDCHNKSFCTGNTPTRISSIAPTHHNTIFHSLWNFFTINLRLGYIMCE
jgi:hypothetical protein